MIDILVTVWGEKGLSRATAEDHPTNVSAHKIDYLRLLFFGFRYNYASLTKDLTILL